jgi:hypothetical protein
VRGLPSKQLKPIKTDDGQEAALKEIERLGSVLIVRCCFFSNFSLIYKVTGSTQGGAR